MRPSGISASQFTRWHLDHHNELGSATDDPKRFHLSPKRNARWYKLLYFTPALFPIYFRAARAEAQGYPLRRILFRHILPNAAGPLIVQTSILAGIAILIEAMLSFLGLGTSAGTPSLKSLAS